MFFCVAQEYETNQVKPLLLFYHTTDHGTELSQEQPREAAHNPPGTLIEKSQAKGFYVKYTYVYVYKVDIYAQVMKF